MTARSEDGAANIHQVPHQRLEALIAAIFSAKGCSADEASRVGRYLVRANLTGHDSHGVVRAARYVSLMEMGHLVPDQEPLIETHAGPLVTIDARYGFGQSVGPAAVRVGIERANAHGVGIVALRHSGHLGRIGEWAELAAAEGLCSIHFVNVSGSRFVAPFGGVERRFSTAPFCAGFPRKEGRPVILDFATSLVAEGKVLVALKGGKPLPEGALIAEDGTLSAAPSTLYGTGADAGGQSSRNGTGAIRAFGEHKGSGLALMCELFAGALTGSGCAGPGERQFCNGMLSIYLAPGHFGSAEAFFAETESYLDFIKSCRPAVEGQGVQLPGEPEAACLAERTATGVPLPGEVVAVLAELAAKAGIDAEDYLGRIAA